MASAKQKRSASGDDEDKTQIAIISQEDMKQPNEHNKEANHRPGKTIQLMSHSGQTGAERKSLRRELRQMKEDILSGDAGLDEDRDRVRLKNNQLFDKVRYTKEAVLESKNLELITAHAAKEANGLVTLPRYDAIQLATKLKEKVSVRSKYGNGTKKYFGWKDFSIKAGICFNSLPKNVSFLYGPMDAEYKSKKRAPRRKRAADEDDITMEQPIEVDQQHRRGAAGNELSAVEQHMKTTYQTLVAKSKEQLEEAERIEVGYANSLKSEMEDLGLDVSLIERKTKRYKCGAQKVDVIQALFDPRSFTQTVENISHLAHFVKENRVAVEVRNADEARASGFGGPGPLVLPLSKKQEEPPPPTQAIVALNMKVNFPCRRS